MRTNAKVRVAFFDEDVKSSHSKDVESGEVLVNRRFLLSGENEPDQRRIFFYSRYKYEEKCCDVIIEGGSTKNLVSEKMVMKLKLKR